jgi:hypothetical protein
MKPMSIIEMHSRMRVSTLSRSQGLTYAMMGGAVAAKGSEAFANIGVDVWGPSGEEKDWT